MTVFKSQDYASYNFKAHLKNIVRPVDPSRTSDNFALPGEVPLVEPKHSSNTSFKKTFTSNFAPGKSVTSDMRPQKFITNL